MATNGARSLKAPSLKKSHTKLSNLHVSAMPASIISSGLLKIEDSTNVLRPSRLIMLDVEIINSYINFELHSPRPGGMEWKSSILSGAIMYKNIHSPKAIRIYFDAVSPRDPLDLCVFRVLLSNTLNTIVVTYGVLERDADNKIYLSPKKLSSGSIVELKHEDIEEGNININISGLLRL